MVSNCILLRNLHGNINLTGRKKKKRKKFPRFKFTPEKWKSKTMHQWGQKLLAMESTSMCLLVLAKLQRKEWDEDNQSNKQYKPCTFPSS